MNGKSMFTLRPQVGVIFMSRLIRRASTLLAGVAVCVMPSLTTAQDQLNETVNEEVTRVIRLRSKTQDTTDLLTRQADSASERLAQNPLASPSFSPAQIKYDEISSRATPMPTKKKPAKLTGYVEHDSISIAAPTVDANISQTKSSSRKSQSAPPAPTKVIRSTPSATAYQVESAVSNSMPSVATEIIAPKDINVNEVAPLRINVQNVGKTSVENVKIVTTLPSHVNYETSSLTPTSNNGELVFTIPQLAAGQTRQISLDITPTEKRELDIATRVFVESGLRLAVNVRQPQLALSVTGPNEVNIGSTTLHTVTIENTGDGIAQQVRLEADFPGELRFMEQTGMKNVRSLKPGEKVQVQVKSLAQAPGQCKLDFAATGTGCQAQPASSPVRITQPELKVSAVGPDMNFVERDGIYSISVDNAGEVDVENVQVTLSVPSGMKVTTISRQAKINEKNGTLSWTFPRMPAQSVETIQLKATAMQPGEQICRILVSSNDTREKEVALKTIVATRADLSINLNNVGGPIQVGNEAEFLVVVENRGSSLANEIQIQVELPESMRPVNHANAFVEENENSILFMDTKLEPGKTREFRFKAVGVAKGEHIVRSTLQVTGSERRVIAEDSVYIYEPAEARVSESLSPTIPR
jgi:uncharacterized repeat protein (TIGR01451 family)